jgi:hypothetical protein
MMAIITAATMMLVMMLAVSLTAAMTANDGSSVWFSIRARHRKNRAQASPPVIRTDFWQVFARTIAFLVGGGRG